MKNKMNLLYLLYLYIINLLVLVEGIFSAIIILFLCILERIFPKSIELFDKQKVI